MGWRGAGGHPKVGRGPPDHAGLTCLLHVVPQADFATRASSQCHLSQRQGKVDHSLCQNPEGRRRGLSTPNPAGLAEVPPSIRPGPTLPTPVPPCGVPPHRAGAQRQLAQLLVSNTAWSRSHSWKARLCVLVTPGGGDSGSAGQHAVAACPLLCCVTPQAVSPPVLTVLAVQLQNQAAGTGLEQDEAFPHRLLQ